MHTNKQRDCDNHRRVRLHSRGILFVDHSAHALECATLVALWYKQIPKRCQGRRPPRCPSSVRVFLRFLSPGAFFPESFTKIRLEYLLLKGQRIQIEGDSL